MAREKELVQQGRPGGAAPALRPRPRPPEKAAGPARPPGLARLALAPGAGLGAAPRARLSGAMQRSVGNARLSRMLEAPAQQSVDLSRLSREGLQQRLDQIELSLLEADQSTPETARLEQEGARIRALLPTAVPRTTCSGNVASDKVVVDHRVTPDVIERPGDAVTFTATFACAVKYGGFSQFVAPDGNTFNRRSFQRTGQFVRSWNGKRPFPSVGTYVADDGIYYHELDQVKYAVKGKTDLIATGPKLRSPAVRVNVRGFTGSGGPESHNTPANVAALAAIIESEMGIGSDDEKKAIAWCVRNQMLRLGTTSVATARSHFKAAHGQAAKPGARAIAEEILKKPLSADVTGGAIKWFSPRSMPKADGKCAGFDCGGGLIDVTDDAGQLVKAYAPSFHDTMTYVPIPGVREWFLRVYR